MSGAEPELVRRWWSAERGEASAAEIDLRVAASALRGRSRVEFARDHSSVAALLDDRVPVRSLDDTLDLRDLVTGQDGEPLGVRTHCLVLRDGHRHPLDAVDPRALAEKVEPVLTRAEPCGDLLDAFVDLAHRRLVRGEAAHPLVDFPHVV